MTNMFSNQAEKTIPSSLSECTRSNATADNLHLWSERLEAWGKVLFWILIVYGIVTTIFSSRILEGVILEEYSLINYTLLITSIIETVLYSFLEYCAYHVLALLISSLALITQNAIISANVSLYQASKKCSDSNPDFLEEVPKVTAIFKDSESDSFYQEINQPNTPMDMWTCKKCGTKNKANYGQCKKCGKFRS